MSIKFAILGFLSRAPATGYELKKQFADDPVLYWSGNNNQIYRALLELHRDGLVTQDVELHEDSPPRKVYSINPAGRDALRDWVRSTPELPQLRHGFLVQLTWGDVLTADELDALLAEYAEEVRVEQLMLREWDERNAARNHRTGPGAWLNARIRERWQAFYAQEEAWVQSLRDELKTAAAGGEYPASKEENDGRG